MSARRPKARLAAAVLLPAALVLPATPAHAATAAALPTTGASTVYTRPADADAALNAFIRVFWDPKKKYFFTNSDRKVHPEHAYGPENGRYTDFWWEAQLWELVMDAYQRTRRPEYRRMIDDVYAGFVAYYPDFENDFNDDIGWWAMAATRAYEITKNKAYLDRAKTLFDRIWAYHDDTLGGGIWWKNTEKNQKNVATNAPAVVTAVRLYTATRDPSYLTRAKGLYAWIDDRLQENGHVYDHFDPDGTLVKWDFTYNFGNYISAATALYEVTGERAYLDDAIRAADWATTYLTNGGTLMNEGVDDGGGFKTLLIRGLHRLVTRHGQRQYLGFLQHQVNQAWSHRRRSDNLVGPNWSAPTPAGYLQSLTAGAAVAALQLVPPDGTTGIQPENGVYEAENAITTEIGAESIHAGYTGRGYLAGWSSANQYVTFHVNVARTGRYTLNLRYSGGAGDAGRRITVNDRVVAANHTFPGTGDWGNWGSTTLRDVRLKRGHNTIRVDIDPGSGNGNWLNFDQLTLAAR